MVVECIIWLFGDLLTALRPVFMIVDIVSFQDLRIDCSVTTHFLLCTFAKPLSMPPLALLLNFIASNFSANSV